MGTIKSILPGRTLIPVHRVFLVTVHDPICTEIGNLADALYGSFLPVPSDDLFSAHEPSAYARDALPGAIIVKNERIVINRGRERVRIKVTNNGDRPVQVSESCTPDHV
jgi:urease